jgi:hypothetical protein
MLLLGLIGDTTTLTLYYRSETFRLFVAASSAASTFLSRRVRLSGGVLWSFFDILLLSPWRN